MTEEGILLRITIEMVGQPKAVLLQALKNVSEEIKEKYEASDIVLSDAEKIGTTLLSAFVEMKVRVKNYEELSNLVIDYMPSFVEVLEPNKIVVELPELEQSINNFVAIIQKLDKQLKYVAANNVILQKKLQELDKNSSKQNSLSQEKQENSKKNKKQKKSRKSK